jgi:diketogulonate reductase-like aldo/keto reductase
MATRHDPRRRDVLRGLAALGAAALQPPAARADDEGPRTRPIPATGEALPVIGMGTWITFNVGDDPVLRAERTEVLRAFLEQGGGMVDSSPMYGTSEEVVGHCWEQLGRPPGLFSATKVWTPDAQEGPVQVRQSERLWGVERLDLEQVHNLVAWREHLGLLRDLKADGRIRYLGITTSHGRRHRDLERVMEREPLDFVQLTYNVVDREAEARLLPLAAERGIAVIANRPFRGGPLVDFVQRHPLPPWAAELGAANWPQVLLKWIIGHPAVTCAIPATRRVAHMRENMGASRGPLPDPELRTRIVRHVEQL